MYLYPSKYYNRAGSAQKPTKTYNIPSQCAETPPTHRQVNKCIKPRHTAIVTSNVQNSGLLTHMDGDKEQQSALYNRSAAYPKM